MSLENLGFVQERSDSHKKHPSLTLKKTELLQSLGLGCKCLEEDVFQGLSHELVAALRVTRCLQWCSQAPFPPHPWPSQRAQL